jgi:hypothetical protein
MKLSTSIAIALSDGEFCPITEEVRWSGYQPRWTQPDLAWRCLIGQM